MPKVFTTEITSEEIPSDNPIHQRLLMPYVAVSDWVSGNVLEVGCGEGRGIDYLKKNANTYSAIDKIQSVIESLKQKYPHSKFYSGNIPPLTNLADNSYDFVVSFQVIEHIEDDGFFLREIHRVLKPGGEAYITTPNRTLSLSRNPWHVREYTGEELGALAARTFDKVTMKGVAGNEKVMTYHERNRQAVNRLMRWDVLNLQYRLPGSWLRAPYEWLNRRNRNKLKDQADDLVLSIRHDDYFLTDDYSNALDLFLVAGKNQ